MTKKQCSGCGRAIYWRKRASGLCRKCAGRARRRPIAARLWDRVKKTKTCWLWTGSVNNKGYGMLDVCVAKPQGRQRKRTLVHRISWELEHGTIPTGLCVLHACDIPRCVRPSHLFLGTVIENNKDCMKKGRTQRGEGHYNAKLTARKVRHIRKAHKRGVLNKALGELFSISPATVGDAIAYRTWKSVP